MKKVAFILFMYFAGFGLQAQNLPFSIDRSFQPSLDFRDATIIDLPNVGGFIFQRAGIIKDIWEDTNTGKIYLVGDFILAYDSNQYLGHACLYNDGSLFEDFIFGLPGGGGHFFPINDSTFLSNASGGNFLMDTLANVDVDWMSNFRPMVVCANSSPPFFYKDGSSLWTCSGHDIVVPPDTFPDRYILKVDPQGNFDTAFTVDADVTYANFMRYDSNRILMYAPPRFIYNYNNHKVNGIWRIFLDGTLDTTFNAPISDAWADGGFVPSVEVDGKIFLSGYFLLEGNNTYHTLIRLNVNGSLDSTFMNHSGPVDTVRGLGEITAIAPTPDGGYLVGGIFNEYQGYERNGIAKVDQHGAVEPQYFTGEGIDSAFLGNPYISRILPSAFGGYYVVGNFRSWDGQPSQPIIRLHGHNVGLEENRKEISKLILYPNPSKENIRFESVSAKAAQKMFLIDIQGKSITAKFRNKGLYTYEVDVSQLKRGMYFLKVISEGELSVGKFVKQ